jgi:HEAT repeat protein
MIYIGLGDPSAIEPVIRRMLGSTYPRVRESAGMIAAFAGLDLGLSHLLTATRDSHDATTRKGAARMCARRLSLTASAPAATDALQRFLNDNDEEVRKAAAEVAGHLRDRALRPFLSVLTTLIASPAFSESLSQLLLTLQQARDRIDDLVIQCARRFLDLHSSEIGNIATAAAGEAPNIGQLVLRAYAQAPDPTSRAAVLDLIDELLLASAYDFSQAVNQAER